MKILSNYDELILSIDSSDTKRFESLLAYSDCRNDLINKYVENYGVENIHKITKNVQARALKNELEKICLECKNLDCQINNNSLFDSRKMVYIHEENIRSNQRIHHT